MDIGGGGKCFLPCLGVADDDGDGEVFQVVPFLDLGWPCVARYAEWGDDQRAAGLEGIEHEVVQRGQRDDGLAHAETKEDGSGRVGFNEVDGLSLVVMRNVFHG